MNFYKKWPYWLRGGAIAGVIAITSFALTQLCEHLVVAPNYSGLGLGCIPFIIPWIPFWFFSITELPLFLHVLVGTMLWFLLGSAIGAVIGYIKSNKK